LTCNAQFNLCFFLATFLSCPKPEFSKNNWSALANRKSPFSRSSQIVADSLRNLHFTHSTFSASPLGFCFRNCLAAFHLSYRGRKTLADRFRGAISFSRKLHFVVSAASYSSLNATPSDALSHAPIGVTSRKTETSDCLAPQNNQKTQDHLGISEHLPAEVLPYSSRTWNFGD